MRSFSVWYLNYKPYSSLFHQFVDFRLYSGIVITSLCQTIFSITTVTPFSGNDLFRKFGDRLFLRFGGSRCPGLGGNISIEAGRFEFCRHSVRIRLLAVSTDLYLVQTIHLYCSYCFWRIFIFCVCLMKPSIHFVEIIYK